jgi:glycosyltransferase involved in cell wall biosynthesis
MAIRKIKPDLVHFPHYNVPLSWFGRFVVTIYDITKTEFGREASNIKDPVSYFIKQTVYNFTLRRAVQESLKIIAGSDSTKNKIMNHFKIGKEKIVTVYAGVDKLFFSKAKKKFDLKVGEKVLERYKIRRPFVLYIGNAFPYKNLPVVLEALKLTRKKINFVYVSSRDTFVAELANRAADLGMRDQLIISGFVPDEDLAALYRLAECLVFPSLSEGFGLPGVEAMAAGCPVVCSNIPVFKEVYGDAATYFDPKKPKEIAEKIEFIIHNSEFRIQQTKKGFGQVRKYSWKSLALETLNIYKGLTAQKSC